MKDIDINHQFKAALDLLEEGKEHVFITGRAGTGKSTLLSWFQEQTKRLLVVLAPTGVAALNVGGETIHSFFRFPPSITVAEAEKRAAKTKDAALYKSIKTIIIDEISMVRADLLDCVDVFLRRVLKKKKPFGGIQMVFIGDLYQLPPVLTTGDREHFSAVYETPYFFSARVMASKDFKPHFIELEKVYRQKDSGFIELLNAIRNNAVTDGQLAELNRRVIADGIEVDQDCICLTTTNDAADRINLRKLSLLRGKLFSYPAQVDGDFERKLAPADPELKLKAGAQVMFLNNNPEGLWVNGTLGVVKDITKEAVRVQTQDGHRVSVTPYKWTLYRYVFDQKTRQLSQESMGSFIQYPLNLAWAVTIHKSQGKTFDRVIIDLGRGTFAHGQAYVALSRCRTLGGLALTTPLAKKHIIMDYRVVHFLTRFQYDRAAEQCPFDEKVRIIEAAIKSNSPVHITYLKPNDQKSRRTVRPRYVGDMEYQGKHYVGMEGYCLQRQEARVFRVDRILEIKA